MTRPNTRERDARPATAPSIRPTLTDDEQLWLDRYLHRVRNADGDPVARVLIHGSKARGDARPDSDLDVVVIVRDHPDAAAQTRDLTHKADDPYSVEHDVVVEKEMDWRRAIDREMPFARNVEAEGIQVYPVHRPAKMPPGQRPPVTDKGIANVVPMWMKRARQNLETLALELEALEAGTLTDPAMAARPAFDAVFFSAMAWCLTRRVPIVRRKDLPTSVENHLIAPGALAAGWLARIQTVHTAWKAEIDWRPDGRPETTIEDARAWTETAREFYSLAETAVTTTDSHPESSV